MSAFHIVVAVLPLALYLLILGCLNLRRRPYLTTGARDTAALALALSGFVAIGPMELLMPVAAANQFGPYVWLLLITLYLLGVVLGVLLMRPRLVIYNCTLDQLRPALAEVVGTLDEDPRWAGECLALPQLGVQLHVQAARTMRTVQLVGVGPNQSFEGWRRLHRALRAQIRKTSGSASAWGALWIVHGVALLGVSVWLTINDPQAIADAFRHTLQW